MPVIIDDVTVEVAPAQPAEPASPAAAAPPPVEAELRKICDLINRLDARSARVAAD